MSGLVVVFASLLAGGTATAVGTYAWYRRSDQPGADGFAALMAGAAIWSFAYAIALTTWDPTLRFAMEVPLEVGKAIIAPAWLVFALGYTGRGEYVNRGTVMAVMAFPVATIVAVATNPVHHLMWASYGIEPTLGLATVAFDRGPWFFLHAVYGYGLVAAGMLAVLQTIVKQGPLYREQALALFVGTVPPTVFHLKRTFEVGPLPHLDLTPLGLAVTGLAFGYGLFRFDLLGFVPASRRLGRQAAIDNVGVGVAVVDDDGVVVEANERLGTVFGVPADDVVGDDLGDRLPVPVDALAGDDLVEIEGDVGRRTYEATVDAVTDHHGRVVARTITFTDVTAREQRRQRLDVLNRVLRHNLRNDMNVVRGHARTLAADLDDAHGDMAAAVARQAEGLVQLGEKARQLDRIASAPETTFDAVPVVERATAAARDAAAPDGGTSAVDEGGVGGETGDTQGGEPETGDVGLSPTLAVDVPPSATVRGDPDTLSVVVENLVENALVHGAGPVAVTLTATDVGHDLIVADAGDGIPDQELAAVLDGTETALQHGSGVGLWLVRWGVDALGGDLGFETADGTRVTVSLPAP